MSGLLLLIVLAGCGEKDDDTGDGGTSDGGSADGGSADGGSADGGSADGGSFDCDIADPVSLSCPVEGGDHFVSLEEHECGLSNDGEMNLCPWTVDFAAEGTWEWAGSDYGEAGTWLCDEGSLIAWWSDGHAVETAWDADSATLCWDDLPYRAR